MKKKKIVWLVPSANPIYLNIYNALGKKHPHLELFLVSPSKSCRNNDYFSFISINNFSPFKIKGINYISDLEKKFSKINPDIIISDRYFNIPTLQAYNFAKKNKVKLVIATKEESKRRFLRNSLFFLWNTLVGNRIISYADSIFSWTHDSKEFMEAFTKGKKKIHQFSAGIDTNKFNSNKRQHYNRKGKLNLLMVARMIPGKDHKTLLTALRSLPNEFSVTLVGKGKLEKEIRKMIKKYDLSERVEIINKIDHDKMIDVYGNHDVLILPSTKDVIGMVVPEAMACGTPVIVSDIAGAKDYVINGKSGLIFEAGNSIDLKNKILEISKMDIRKMGESASEHIRTKYNIEKVADDFYKILKTTEIG